MNIKQMKKKVLFITHQYPPCASSGVFRTIRFIKNLSQFGWTPVVLTIAPEFYDENVPIDNKIISKNKELNKIIVYRSKALPTIDKITSLIRKHIKKKDITISTSLKNQPSKKLSQCKTKWQQFKDGLTISLRVPDKQNTWIPFAIIKGFFVIKKEKPIVIYATGGPWSSFIIGTLLAKISGLPLIIDFRDPWIDNPYDELHFFIRNRLNKLLEKKCVQTADYVIANTEPLRKMLMQKYAATCPTKFVTLLNSFDESEFENIKIEKNKKSSDFPVVVSHIGTLYAARSPINFIYALSALIKHGLIDKKNIRIKFIGNVQVPGLKRIVEGESLAGVIEFTGHVAKHESLKMAMESDILLLIQPETKLQIPAKVFEYIRTGNSIFTICDEGATKELILSKHIGRVAKYDSIREISQQFINLYNEVYANIQRKTKKVGIDKNIIEKFDSKNMTMQFVNLLEKITIPKNEKNETLKVMHIVNSFGIGGMENGVVNIINNIDNIQHSICSLTSIGAMKKRIKKKNVQFYALNKVGVDRLLFFKLYHVLKKAKPDIIHIRHWGALFDAIITSLLLFKPFKIIFSYHGKSYDEYQGIGFFKKTIRKGLLLFVDRIIALNPVMENELISDYSIGKKIVKSIGNGIDINKFSSFAYDKEFIEKFGNKTGITNKDFVIGTIGRLDKIKNIKFIINNFLQFKKEINSAKLLIVGNGKEKNVLLKMAERSNYYNDIIFAGQTDNAAPFYQLMNVYVQSSFYEGFSNTILEAMASGLPIVCSDVGGNRTLVEHGVNGFLFDIKRNDEFIKYIKTICSNNNLHQLFSINSRKKVENAWSVRIMSNNYKRLYYSFS